MYSVYAVRLINGDKDRYFIGSYENEVEAKHVANCCTLGNADYAYVKDFGEGTTFFIRKPDYCEAPLSPTAQDRLTRASPAL